MKERFYGENMEIFINRWSDNIDSPENNPIYSGNPSDEIWTTEDERHLRVGNMTDEHIRNCYCFVLRTPDVRWRYIFKAELNKRGIEI